LGENAGKKKKKVGRSSRNWSKGDHREENTPIRKKKDERTRGGKKKGPAARDYNTNKRTKKEKRRMHEPTSPCGRRKEAKQKKTKKRRPATPTTGEKRELGTIISRDVLRIKRTRNKKKKSPNDIRRSQQYIRAERKSTETKSHIRKVPKREKGGKRKKKKKRNEAKPRKARIQRRTKSETETERQVDSVVRSKRVEKKKGGLERAGTEGKRRPEKKNIIRQNHSLKNPRKKGRKGPRGGQKVAKGGGE